MITLELLKDLLCGILDLGFWDLGFLMLAFFGILEFGIWGFLMLAHVTVSVVWRDKGKGVTCNGFWGFGGIREKVSHVTVSGVWAGQGKRCHM